MSKLLQFIESYLREVAAQVPVLAEQGAGRAVLGSVPGRPESEDVEIALDRICEELFLTKFRDLGTEIVLYSEHGTRHIGREGGRPEHLVSLDPFDGSGLFLRGLSAEWWSVLTVFTAENKVPCAGGAVDVLRGELYLALDGEATLLSLDDGSRTALTPSRKTAIDNDTVIAAYLMNPTYLLDWTEKSKGLLGSLLERFPGVRLWPNGGSCIYPWLARGLVHAYLMFDEPRSEIDPGLAFAWATGYPVYSVQTDGSLVPYQFMPGGQAERVPFFIAACTRELAEEIVQYIESPARLNQQ